MSTETRPELQFGTLALVDPLATSGDGSYWFDTYGDDFALGSPQPVNEAIQTLLQDGSKVITTGYDNREVSLTVVVSGSDMDALASGESALFLECSKPNTLTYTPADGYGAATLFEVWTSSLEPVTDDLLEVTQLQRAYKLTLICAPFGGSDIEITTVGVTSSATPSTVVINDASSVTGWTAMSYDGDETPYPATAGSGQYVGAVQGDLNLFSEGGGRYSASGSLIYTPASAVDMSSTTFLQVDWATSSYARTTDVPRAFADGVELSMVASSTVPNTPYTRSTFVCSDASVAEFRIKAPHSYETPDGSSGLLAGDLLVDQLIRTNQAPSSGTLRQKVSRVAIKGSARTQGSLKIEHPSSALGYTMIHTCPDLGDGYTPDLSRWATGAGTADSSLISGSVRTYDGTTYVAPLRMLRPGPYVLVARVRASTNGDYVLNGAHVSITDATWRIETLTVMEIADHIAGTAFSQTILLDQTAGPAGAEVDEAWLFYIGDDAALTRVDLGTGAPSATGSSNRLFIDTATTSRPYPGLWRGTLADKSDARSAVTDSVSWGDHMFAPPSATIFTVTSNALDAQVSLTHRPRWHTHAGSIE